MSDLNWYMVRLRGRGSVHRAAGFLELYRVRFYYPQLRIMVPVGLRRLSKKQRAAGVPLLAPRLVPLFPGYMFIELDYERPWRSSFHQAGIEGLVSARPTGIEGEVRAGQFLQPVRFPESFVRKLKGAEVDDAIPGETPADYLFSRGETVKVTGGALAGRMVEILSLPDKTIEQVDSRDRLTVSVSAFGRVLSVDLTIGQIAKVSL